MKTFHLVIVSKLGLYLEEDVSYLSAFASDGKFGILPNYTPFISDLKICKLSYTKNDKIHDFAIGGGILYIENNICNVVVNSIESKSDIDLDRAYRAKERALNRINSHQANIDIKRAQLALSRALNRIDVKSND